MSEAIDVFVSYAHADQAWVRVLAENLYQAGLNVFYDEWMIAAGDVLVHKLDEGIRNSRNGVLVVSPAALERPWVQEEYAAMLTRAVAGKQRLIPVLLQEAEMPPFLASRVWVDFRNADGPVYQARMQELIKALKGPPGPPPRTGELQPPPGTGFQAQGTMQRCLRIDSKQVELLGGEQPVQGATRGLDSSLEQCLWALEHTRRSGLNLLSYPVRGTGGQTLEELLADAGRRLGQAFLPEPVAQGLEQVLAEAGRLHNVLDLGIEIDDPALLNLPWEILRLPSGGPALTLYPQVNLYRRLAATGPAAAISIPGPLRILVAIGSPEAQNARGELLDMEAELARILAAVDSARRDGKAFVRILENGGVTAIREALEQQRYHVLYISCHAAPGRLILEDDRGQADKVTAQRLWEEALPPGKGVPLLILAGCSTGKEAEAQASAALPSVARELVEHGVPAVIAMQGPVGDLYATALGGLLFKALATWEQPLPLPALAEARRQLERERQQNQSLQRPPPEWALPTLYTARQALPLYDPRSDFEKLKPILEPTLDRGVIVRRVGEFVGRRREQRLALRSLREPEHAGVLIHGMGGVGKSTLAAQVLYRLAREGWLLVSVTGVVDTDKVLETVAGRLLSFCLEQGKAEDDPWRRLAALLREPKISWQERLQYLSQLLLEQYPLALLLDNFEDNLDTQRQVKQEELGRFLADWLQAPGRSRLVFTCRYPFLLPEELQTALEPLPLGPLSLAETRKLVWRLPGLDALPPAELQRAYEQVGGHPRALEYLDALLRGGKARFGDVERRLKQALQAKGITDPGRWYATTRDNFNQALAEAVTLAADDVLLDALLQRLEEQPLARQLLLGAAVYREPVDELGLVWQVGETVEPAGESQPPVQPPAGFAEAVTTLVDLSLLSPFQLTDDEVQRYIVHRWTAGALARRFPQVLTEAHRRAARYWDWRVRTRSHSLEEHLETRYHFYQAGEVEQAVECTESICLQLGTWGAWSREEYLCREVLTWVPAKSATAAKFLHQLGIVAQRQGDYEGALKWYRQALEILEALGDRAGMARSYHQLGGVAEEQGDYEGALNWYRRSLEILEALGDRAGMAGPYHQLGTVAQRQGDYEGALKWYRQALEILEALGDRAGMAGSYHQLGTVAQDQGDYEGALEWYRRSLEIKEALGNRAGMANSYHQLGMVAQDQGDYQGALGWYQRSLEIKEALGNQAGMARSYHALGMVAQDQGDYQGALGWYQRSLELLEALGDRAGIANSYGQIGVLLTETGKPDEAVPLNLRSLAICLELGVPEVSFNLYWLNRQREALGEQRFLAVLRKHLDENRVTAVLKWLEDSAAGQ
jgi:tetratricopeptide (TPR) repeat protein